MTTTSISSRRGLKKADVWKNRVLSSFNFQTLTNVFLIKYLLNIFILLITVMLMPTVPTPKDHFIARVIMVILGMV